tara:strand:- start:559 stop:801 length:243 start_codon:yes stop_codon:yes gene_type:complete
MENTTKFNKRVCLQCNKPLKLIGEDRKNVDEKPEFKKDWENRKYHKKCFKIMKNKVMYYDTMRRELGNDITDTILEVKTK